MGYPLDSVAITESNVSEEVTYLRPSEGWAVLDLGEVWSYRELLFFLAWRDIKVRYKQTVLGAAWAVIQPFFMMVVFSIFFGLLARIPSDGLPYPVFAYSALLPWTYFSYALNESSNSLVTNANLLSKVYFARLVIPLASTVAGLIDLGIAFVILIAMMVFYGITPTWAALTLPLFVLLAVMTALAVGLWLSALNVRYRDVRYAIPFLVNVWMFATPIAYPSSLVPEPFRFLYGINPMVGVVEGFRWALLQQTANFGPMLAVSVLAVIGLLVGGFFYFRRTEQTFADVV